MIENVPLLQFVSLQWFLYKPNACFFLSRRIFLSLMEAAELTDLLKQEGDFTLFAPSDKAFAVLSERDLALLKGKNPRYLFSVCFNH